MANHFMHLYIYELQFIKTELQKLQCLFIFKLCYNNYIYWKWFDIWYDKIEQEASVEQINTANIFGRPAHLKKIFTKCKF